MMRALLRTTHVAAAMFVFAEAFAWWVALQAIATAMTRDGYASLAARIQEGRLPGVDQAAAQRAVDVAQGVAAHGSGGPSLPVVLVTAAGAFLLVRCMTKQRLPVVVSAVGGVAVSLIVFQALVRYAGGDFRLWGAAHVLQAPGGAGDDAGLAAFIASPDGGLPVRGAVTITAFGLGALWVRFLIAGRGGVTYERVMRSFGAGFLVLIVTGAIVAFGEGVDLFGWLPVYFVLGVAALAVAQAARAGTGTDDMRGTQPWLVSLGITLAGIAVILLAFELLALMDAQRLFAPVVGAIVWVAGRLALIVLYPFALLMQAILSLIIGGHTLNLNNLNPDLLQPTVPKPTPGAHPPVIPSLLALTFRAAAILAVTWVLYRLGIVLFAARQRMGEAQAHAGEHFTVEGETPRGLLRGFFHRRPTDGISGDWLRQHRVYALFARVVRDARARGVERPTSDTPLEFAHESALRLDASAFEPIGRAFDEARYGRHFADEAETDSLERSLREWEETHPGSDVAEER